MARVGPLGPDEAARRATAERHLAALMDLFERGMRAPLPLYSKTSAAWAEAAAAGRDPAASAGRAWTSSYEWDNEDKDPEHVLVLGTALAFDAMVARSGRPDPDERGWEPSEDPRFGAYARRLWDGLLAHEQMVDR